MKPGWLVFILSLLMYGCCNADSSWDKELDRLDNSIEKEYKEKYNLELIATGGGSVEGFELYTLRFIRYGESPIEESRVLILTLAERVLTEINQNPSLVKGMIKYPFTTKNLDLGIFIRKPDGNFLNEDEIDIVGISGKKIRYVPYKSKRSISDTTFESIKTALEKVQNSRSRFPYLWECVEKSGAGK